MLYRDSGHSSVNRLSLDRTNNLHMPQAERVHRLSSSQLTRHLSVVLIRVTGGARGDHIHSNVKLDTGHIPKRLNHRRTQVRY